MITPSDLHIFATTNQLTAQTTCLHIIDTSGGTCDQAAFIKGFCTQHAPLYEEDLSKLFKTSIVDLITVNDTRKVVATSELRTGEILGIYPALRRVNIGDLIGVPSYGPYKDYDIPRMIEPGIGEVCNCVLEL